MSYCRWSTDNFQCDLYVYAHMGGFYSINVAGSRYKQGMDPMASSAALKGQDLSAWCAANMEPIGLPYDGKTFEEGDEDSAIARLLELRALGYRFPDYVLDALREEKP